MTLGCTNFTNFPENQLTTVYALAQEVTERRPALKISAWTPSMTVHPYFKNLFLVSFMTAVKFHGFQTSGHPEYCGV